MNRDKLILLFSCIATVVLGPGVGHLMIKEWKKAVLLMIIAFVLFLILAVFVISAVGNDALNAVANFENVEQFMNIYSKFQEDNSKIMLIFNALFAALWAYSVVDLFMIAKKKGIFIKQK